MVEASFNKMAKEILKPVTKENIYKPQLTHGELKKFWGNSWRGSYNEALANRISEIKAL